MLNRGKPRRNNKSVAFDYEDRINDVWLTLNGEFGMGDREAMEILLASRIDCDLPYPWMVLEMPYYSLNPEGAWFTYLTGALPIMLPMLRVLRPRASNKEIQQLLRDRDVPKTFVESNWELPSKPHGNLSMWPYLLQECVRVRCEHPKRALPTERAGLILAEAVHRANDSRWREKPPITLPTPPVGLHYYAEMLQRLSPGLRSWEALISNLCALAARRAYLFNRDVDSTDWQCVSRVMKDSVPPWVADMLAHNPEHGKLFSTRGKYEDSLRRATIKHLAGEGVVFCHKGEWMIRGDDDIRSGIRELIAGISF